MKTANTLTALEIMARLPEGKSVDVPRYLREHGNPEAAQAWIDMNEEHRDNFKQAANAEETLDELAKLSTWEEGHKKKDDPRDHKGEGSLTPGMEEKKAAQDSLDLLARMATEEYPWEKCIEDKKKDPKVKDPEAVCAWIKNKSQGKAAAEDSLDLLTRMAQQPGDITKDTNLASLEGMLARFEKGKPADPCGQPGMSESECAKWKQYEGKVEDLAESKVANASKRALRGWVISPDQLLHRALMNGLLTVAQAHTRALQRAAQSVAEDLRETWPEGEGFGSSDGTYAVKQMLEEAGFKMAFVGGRLSVVQPPMHLAAKEKDPKNEDPEAPLDETWGKSALHPPQVHLARMPSGLYGYTRAIQSSCEGSISKLTRVATALARRAYQKDEKVPTFLAVHAKRGSSLPAKILVAAMKGLGPKIASQIELAETETDMDKTEKTAAQKGPKYGLYGYSAKTANLGLLSCANLREAAGHIASDLHSRRAEHHANIIGFLQSHAKQARCLYSRLLQASYPDAELRLASTKDVGEWLAWEE
jgi:hypothetical protein